MRMYDKAVTVNLKQGLHARPAAEFVQKAHGFKSKVTIVIGDKSADAKSILGIMGLGVKPGTEVVVRGDGEDEVKAVEALIEILTRTD